MDPQRQPGIHVPQVLADGLGVLAAHMEVGTSRRRAGTPQGGGGLREGTAGSPHITVVTLCMTRAPQSAAPIGRHLCGGHCPMQHTPSAANGIAGPGLSRATHTRGHGPDLELSRASRADSRSSRSADTDTVTPAPRKGVIAT
ncbi:hypothetical protein GCM10009864_27530 [Streptomyces lunalinharesii]|uniref:Uncharacterized protein n=1 Tax=Streptomyces lunalinharesii TaxID=333384 RepID=A0ABP6E3H5_9ACTN